MRDNVVVATIDVGGRANIGWVIEKTPESAEHDSGTGNQTLDELAQKIIQQVEDGRSVALGIESPLYLPIADTTARINSARAGEHNSAWSASAGSSVTPLGVHRLAYVLSGLRSSLTADQVGFDERLLDRDLRS